jgi:hypothetical protein
MLSILDEYLIYAGFFVEEEGAARSIASWQTVRTEHVATEGHGKP